MLHMLSRPHFFFVCTEFYGITFFKDSKLVDELVDRNVGLPVPCTPYFCTWLCSHLLFPCPRPRLSRDTASLPPSTDNVRSLDTRGRIKYIYLICLKEMSVLNLHFRSQLSIKQQVLVFHAVISVISAYSLKQTIKNKRSFSFL